MTDETKFEERWPELFEERWPELFEGLSEVDRVAAVSGCWQVLRDGWTLTREDVERIARMVVEDPAQFAALYGEYTQPMSEYPPVVRVRAANTPEELRRIAEGLGWKEPVERTAVAQALIAHPLFTEQIRTGVIETMHARWHGDDPLECRATWEALEEAYEAYYAKLLAERAERGELRVIPGTEKRD